MALSKEELLEGNKLICEFMELVRYNESGHPYEYGYYHQQWNYLMDVVEKIEALGFQFYIHNEGAEIHKWFWRGNFPNTGFVGENKKEAVWKTLLQFIKWYNTQSTQQ